MVKNASRKREVFFCELNRLFTASPLVYAWAMRTLTLLFAFLLAWPLYAKDVYKWTSEEGVILYSDTYRPGAERIHVTGGSTSPQPGVGSSTDEGSQSTSATAGNYEHFEILSPENDETIRSNEGVVPVGLSLTPTLAPGHSIQILLDGTLLEGSLNSTQFTLNNLNRGTHSLEAKVVDEAGNPVMTAPRINFHLRKASIIQPES